jgi:hypothetical protein
MLLKKLALIGGCCSIIFAAQSTFAGSYTLQDCQNDVNEIQTTITNSKTFKTTDCKAGITSIDDKTTKIVKKKLCEATCYNNKTPLTCNWVPNADGTWPQKFACPNQ